MLAQHARRTQLKTSDKGASLAEVVDARLAQHGIDTEKISWDAYRRDDGTWRIVATWPSGKATAQAVWELDKARQLVAPHDDMAQYLCAERAAPARSHSRRTARCPARRDEPRRPRRRPGPAAAGTSRCASTASRAPSRPRGSDRAPTAVSARPDPGRARRPARLARPAAGHRRRVLDADRARRRRRRRPPVGTRPRRRRR